MPKETRASSSRQMQLAPYLDPLVVVYQTRKVAIRRVADYQATLTTIKRSIRALAHVSISDIFLKSDTLPHQDGEYVDISEDAWPDLVFRSYLKTVVVEVENPVATPVVRPAPPQLLTRGAPSHAIAAPHVSPQSSFRLKIESISLDVVFHLTVKPTTTMNAISHAAAKHYGLECADDLRLLWEGNRVDSEATVALLGIEEHDIMYTMMAQVGGKPVIYIAPPASGPSIDATIELSLSTSWSLSALYPIPPGSTRVDSSYGQKTSWTVRANPSGTLHDKATETEVSYLYWEATTNPPRPLSPPMSPRSSPTSTEFDPSRANLSAADSVLLPVDKIPGYLDRALASLALHTEARTSFITYWLPSLLKHEHVALRFVPQAEYEQAARLIVTPKPDVVTRVFMVFRGVDDDEVYKWEPAVERAGENIVFWKDIVGVDASAAQDTSLFRVLEWGGMEVLSC